MADTQATNPYKLKAAPKKSSGMSLIANLKGTPSHTVIQRALEANIALRHRSSNGPYSTDGTGILLQIPHRFLKRVLSKDGVHLPQIGNYGAGLIFLPQEKTSRNAIEKFIATHVTEGNLKILHWRDVPTEAIHLRDSAKKTLPVLKHLFLVPKTPFESEFEFKKALYHFRLKIEAYANEYLTTKNSNEVFEITQLHTRIFVYKALIDTQLFPKYFLDLQEEDLESSFAMSHSQMSSSFQLGWGELKPYRISTQGGRINSLNKNVRQFDAFAHENKEIANFKFTNSSGRCLDQVIEWLYFKGYSLQKSLITLFPEAWEKDKTMNPLKRAFYQYNACLTDPWDGPLALALTDGRMIAVQIDCNGLRSLRYSKTNDDCLILGSESISLEAIDQGAIIEKGRLKPREILLLDTHTGELLRGDTLKETFIKKYPYKDWLEEHCIEISEPEEEKINLEGIQNKLINFGYTYEDLRFIIGPIALEGKQPLGSMGVDTPLAALNEHSTLLYNYFKQQFGQVTQSPIDSIREASITSNYIFLSPKKLGKNPLKENAKAIYLRSPLLTSSQLDEIKSLDKKGFKHTHLKMLFPATDGAEGLKKALDDLFKVAKEAILSGSNILILSDKAVSEEQATIPTLLAVAGLHNYLIANKLSLKASILVETAEAREIHHFATLLSYGAHAICPYLAFQTIHQLVKNKALAIPAKEAISNYLKGNLQGVIKTMGKVGISNVSSYHGTQSFEAVGLDHNFLASYFMGTESQVGGVDLNQIAKETLERHTKAYKNKHETIEKKTIDSGGKYQWRKDGEYHLFNPDTIHNLQEAVRKNDYSVFKKYSNEIDHQEKNLITLRSLLKLEPNTPPIPIDTVEPAEAIIKRFKTGAISFGSISKEAHETMAIAMNRIGGKSNSGEGGESLERFKPDSDGTNRRSAIKQIASGRFGVTSYYLTHADELQIKLSQGAKPGEGGELPSKKVYPWIAKVRHSTAGVGLVSPPGHHDLNSLEDLNQLVYDLRCANPKAKINIKLTSGSNMGGIIPMVAKSLADVILISGHDGGTGASPISSIQNAGLPWELGLAKAHKLLVDNNVRQYVRLETDGQLKTGRDVIIATLLGAEEFGFATTALVTMGCLMMRACHKNTCPVGIATQRPELREFFKGKPEHVERFMYFIAEEVREYLAQLGAKTLNDVIGKTDLLKVNENIQNPKAKLIDLSYLLNNAQVKENKNPRHFEKPHSLFDPKKTFDGRELLPALKNAIETKTKGDYTGKIKNQDRSIGAFIGNQISLKHGIEGLPQDSLEINLQGTAGNSFAAFTPNGMTLKLEGDANDFVGKGLSGAKLILKPDKHSKLEPDKNSILGNVAFYGAVSGNAYISGLAGERFCIRNSGAHVVVEGVGDHGCEYMTGGSVIILGPVGRNFAAGMSGGIAYILKENKNLKEHINLTSVQYKALKDSPKEEIEQLKVNIETHLHHTGSPKAKSLLDNWSKTIDQFVKILPYDYERALNALEKVRKTGLEGDALEMATFEASLK